MFARKLVVFHSVCLGVCLMFGVTGHADTSPDPIIVGLDADMSSGSANSGEAIRRGMALAIDVINRSGGVLGRPMRIVVRDHRGNPTRGIDNIEAFARTENLVAVVGGLHTPVALAELEAINATTSSTSALGPRGPRLSKTVIRRATSSASP